MYVKEEINILLDLLSMEKECNLVDLIPKKKPQK